MQARFCCATREQTGTGRWRRSEAAGGERAREVTLTRRLSRLCPSPPSSRQALVLVPGVLRVRREKTRWTRQEAAGGESRRAEASSLRARQTTLMRHVSRVGFSPPSAASATSPQARRCCAARARAGTGTSRGEAAVEQAGNKRLKHSVSSMHMCHIRTA